MPGKRPSVKNEKQYEALRTRGCRRSVPLESPTFLVRPNEAARSRIRSPAPGAPNRAGQLRRRRRPDEKAGRPRPAPSTSRRQAHSADTAVCKSATKSRMARSRSGGSVRRIEAGWTVTNTVASSGASTGAPRTWLMRVGRPRTDRAALAPRHTTTRGRTSRNSASSHG